MSQPRSYVLEELLGTPDASANANGAHWSRLTSYMSHELRTPLNAVLGFSEMMKGEVFGPLGSEHYADYAKNIHRSGRTLLKSAEDALAITSLLTRVHAGNGNAAAAFHDAVSDALDFHAASLLDQRLEVRVGVDKALEVLAEPQTLRQIVINLLSEIIERAQPGAAILITSDSFIHEASISVVALNALPRLTGGNESFSMILSRTLAQLSGARLVELGSDEECWGVSVSFPLAQQRDFFARAGITGAKPAL